MSTITKERNILTITLNSGYVCTFNVNTGLLYGSSGKHIINPPSGFISAIRDNTNFDNMAIRNICSAICDSAAGNRHRYTDLSDRLEQLSIIDRFGAVGIRCTLYTLGRYPEMVDCALKHLGELVAWKNDVQYVGTDCIYAFYKEMQQREKQAVIEKAVNGNPHYNPNEHLDVFLRIYRDDPEHLDVYIYYILRGLDIYEGDTSYARRKVADYISYCQKAGLPIKKSNNFIMEYVTAKDTYYKNKEAIEKQELVKWQTSQPALAYENEEFVVVVPTTRQEFQQEGQNQDNCVYRLYLPIVIEQKTHIVFIRKKSDPTKSYITCEVRNGNIKQYLAKHNHYVRDESALEFKKQYQDHLNANWK